MKRRTKNSDLLLRMALKTASVAARRIAFKKGLPVVVSRNGRIIFLYKDDKEIPASQISRLKTRRR